MIAPPGVPPVLADGALELLGLLPRSSNYAFLARAVLEAEEMLAVYKPRRGETPLWDFPEGTLGNREAAAYVVAHYFSLLAYEGQRVVYLSSDPLGTGANLFGTSTATVDYGWIGASAIWYVQVAALVLGHVAGLVLAHDRASFGDTRTATRSQYWMLAVMISFTSLGLWLLSATNS